MTHQDILDVSREPNLSLMWIARGSGLSQFDGWFPVHMTWPVSLGAHRTHLATPWPERARETVDTSSPWPDENAETITADSHPEVAATREEIDADAKLKAISDQLKRK